jgi:predicted ribosomally synthesized peptide with SipW-like signal peptide
MKQIFISILTILMIGVIAVSATKAVFFDTETSTDNTFTAGTLDLKIDGGDVNVSHSFTNMEPVHSQPNFTWVLKNAGSLAGYLNIKNISVSSDENGCNEPETSAGDTTCNNPGAGQGELASVLNYRLMLDNNCNGWFEAGDQVIFQGMAGTIADHYTVNKKLDPNQTVCVNSLVNWWSTADDNKAQGDSMKANFGFELNQDAI